MKDYSESIKQNPDICGSSDMFFFTSREKRRMEKAIRDAEKRIREKQVKIIKLKGKKK